MLVRSHLRTRSPAWTFWIEVMTSELQPKLQEVFRRMAGILIAVPLVFIIMYPWLYLVLPDRLQSIADLPQDLQLAFIALLLTAPPLLLGRYAIDRRKRWTVSDHGVEVFKDGVLRGTVPWGRVISLTAEGGGVSLRLHDGRRATRLRFLDKGAVVQAVRIYRCEGGRPKKA